MSKNIVKIFAGIGVVAGLGVALLPLSSYAASQDVNVSFKINATLGGNETICTSATNAPTGIAAGTTSEVTCDISYSANGGASVSIVDKDGTNNLVGTNASNTIVAFSTTANQASLAAGTEGWGYKFVATTTGAPSGGGLVAIANAANYNGVPTGTAVVVGSNTAPVTNAAGTFTFGVQTATTTVADTYSDTVTIAITPAI